MATSSKETESLPAGVEKVAEEDADTTKRAYFGTQKAGAFANPEPGMHYVLVTEHPESWGLESMFSRYERMGYRLKAYANSRKTAAWYEIPQAIIDEREAARQATAAEQRERARQMLKTSQSAGVQTWVAKDDLRKGHPLINNPIVFNG